MAAPRGITQPPTSFIGSQCQGIHHAPLNTYNTKNQNKEKRNCTSQHTTTHNSRNPPRPERRRQPPHGSLRARCSQPLSTNQTPHPTTKVRQQQTPPTLTGSKADHPCHIGAGVAGPVVSKPNSVSDDFASLLCTRPAPTTGAGHPTNRPTSADPAIYGAGRVSWCSLERR